MDDQTVQSHGRGRFALRAVGWAFGAAVFIYLIIPGVPIGIWMMADPDLDKPTLRRVFAPIVWLSGTFPVVGRFYEAQVRMISGR